MARTITCHLGTYKNGPWVIRVDKPHGFGPGFQRHVHLSRPRLKGEYAWNVDGTRHDKHRFPAHEQAIKSAKKIAAEALNVPRQSLQLLTGIEGSSQVFLSEKRPNLRTDSLLSLYIRADEYVLVLGGKGLITFVVMDKT